MKAYSLSQLYEMRKVRHTTVDNEIFLPVYVTSSITGERFELTRILYEKSKHEVEAILSPGADAPAETELTRPILNYSLTVGDFVKAVYLACRQNIWFFLKEFCYITTNIGVSKFVMTAESYLMVDMFEKKYSHILYGIRQTGTSTTLAAIIAWVRQFHPITPIDILDRNLDSQKGLERIISDIQNNMPHVFFGIFSTHHFRNAKNLPKVDYKYYFVDQLEHVYDTVQLERVLREVIADPDHIRLVATSTMNSKFEETRCYKVLSNSWFANPSYIDAAPIRNIMSRIAATRSRKMRYPIVVSALDAHLIFPDDHLTIMRQMFHNDDTHRNEYCPRDVLIERAKKRQILDDGTEVIPGVRAIAAVDENLGIGYDGKLIFNIRDDKRFFKTMTDGQMVVMGRKTMESLPNMMPLSGRINVVITENPSEMHEKYPDHFFFGTVESVLDLMKNYLEQTKGDGHVYIIGGESIYRQMLRYCEEVYLTEIKAAAEADAFFPTNIAHSKLWKREVFMRIPEGPELGYRFEFVRYTRRPQELQEEDCPVEEPTVLQSPN